MKMDIEGMEFQVLPDLLVSGALCQTVDYAFGEMHHRMTIEYSHARGGIQLNGLKQNKAFCDHLFQIFHAARHCRTSRFDILDDEAYLHDGIALPGEE
jgi:hypothetical protein